MRLRQSLIALALALAGATSVYVAIAIQMVPTLVIPVLATALPLMVVPRHQNVTLLACILLLLLFVLAGGFSVGPWYTPPLLLLVAARATRQTA